MDFVIIIVFFFILTLYRTVLFEREMAVVGLRSVGWTMTTSRNLQMAPTFILVLLK